MKRPADIGVVGLAVMGENLILNLADKGYTVACYNRTTSKIDRFIGGRAAGKTILGCRTIQELVSSLSRPRIVMCMIKAGAPVDEFIAAVTPYLDPDDIIIDGGNSHFAETNRRVAELEAKGLRYVGAGISGGEEGALKGPSIMPGGSPAAWPILKPVLQRICAYTEDGKPCCDWIGAGGSGHFVKMVHNGIEYGDLQLIGETYHFMKQGLGLANEAIGEIFARWNRGPLDSYLVEITADILAHREPDGKATVELILDTAGQKGTGRWTATTALELGQPLTLIAEAVFARFLSALKEERVAASGLMPGPDRPDDGNPEASVAALEQALYGAKIVSYAQGYQLLRAVAADQGWNLDYASIAEIWRAGCIIRSKFLTRIASAFSADPGLANLMLDPFFRQELATAQPGWRRVVIEATRIGLPIPAIGAALSYYDGYRTARLPANLLQAQRDYFGAHTYERIDAPRGRFFHTEWNEIQVRESET